VDNQSVRLLATFSFSGRCDISNIMIDLLQGRVPKSVFARHYFTPSLDYRGKVIRALAKLQQQIEE
jgi:hypothetical protein